MSLTATNSSSRSIQHRLERRPPDTAQTVDHNPCGHSLFPDCPDHALQSRTTHARPLDNAEDDMYWFLAYDFLAY